MISRSYIFTTYGIPNVSSISMYSSISEGIIPKFSAVMQTIYFDELFSITISSPESVINFSPA